jgi:TonB-linked SusC/RagA family outer membrane protein
MSFIVGHFSLQAQALKVTGTVTDAKTKEVLPGVSIALQGSNKGAISDVDGKFSIEVPDANASLVFSFVSYVSETISVNGRNQIDVALVPDIKKLDEVVVVAYGAMKKGDLTTAQTSVTAKDMDKTVNTTIEQALQGRTAGVYITQNSGQPGGSVSVNIRGINTINGTNEPLYVIDGVQIAGSSVSYGAQSSSNPLSGLNPGDIADIQVLQGPSATALYGSRATNGVLLITTKRGKAGESKISYNYSYSLQTPPKRMNIMNLQQYATMVKEFHDIAGGTTPNEFLDPSQLGAGTDWQKELFKNAGMYKHQISVSGGKDKYTYYLSGEYMNQDGVAAGSGFDRYGFRINVDNKPKEWLSLGVNISFDQTKEVLTSSQENLIANALQITPQIPVKNLDGSWGGGDDTNGANQYTLVNPIAISSLTTNNNTRRQLLAGVNMDLTILKGLHFRSSFNTNLGYGSSLYFVPAYKIGWAVNNPSSLTNGQTQNTYWNWNQLLDYTKQLGKHNIDVMISHESQQSTYNNVSTGRTNFLTSDILNINAGDPTTASNSGNQGTWAMESYLGRLNYNYGERYIISGSVRRDGSSSFGADNRWGVFPAVSAAWRISKEPFYHINFINELKLRLETGTTGNTNLNGGGIYSSMNSWSTPWGAGFIPNRYSNPALKWEQTQTNNIGINISMLQNRIQIEADYYRKSTSNLIMINPETYYMGSSGVGSIQAPTVNIGALDNNGWAITLVTTNVSTKNFNWQSNFNISGFKTKVTKLYSDAATVTRTFSNFYNSASTGNWQQQSSVGKAPWLFMGYVQKGLFQSVDEINNSAVPTNSSGDRLTTDENNVWVGDVKFKDMNGDGKIDVNDQTTIGNPWPLFFGGFTNTFSYKDIELSILLTFDYGNDVYNYLAQVNTNPMMINQSRNLMVHAMDYARLTTNTDGAVVLANPGTDVPRITYDANGNYNKFTSKWVEDGSYVKVKNITLSYNIPATLLSRQKVVKEARIMFSVQNIATITGYSGYDPEVGAYMGKDVQSSNQPIGLDYGRYPLTPVYTFNLLLNF